MKYEGQTDFYFETGLGISIQFHDNRGLKENEFYDWDWILVFNKDLKIDKIDFFKGNELLYSGPLTFQKERHMNYINYPLELEYDDYCKYINGSDRCVVETDELVDALKIVG